LKLDVIIKCGHDAFVTNLHKALVGKTDGVKELSVAFDAIIKISKD